MTQSKIPGLLLPAPNDPTRTADNFNAILRWSKSQSPVMLGIGAPIVGTNPPAPPSSAYVSQSGLVAVVFVAGVGTLTLPEAFPNGWLSLHLAGANFYGYETAGATLDTIKLLTGAADATYNVDIDAVGW